MLGNKQLSISQWLLQHLLLALSHKFPCLSFSSGLLHLSHLKIWGDGQQLCRVMFFSWQRTGAQGDKCNHTGTFRASDWTCSKWHIPLAKGSSMAWLKVTELRNDTSFTVNHSKGGEWGKISLDFRRPSGSSSGLEWHRHVGGLQESPWSGVSDL